MGGEREADLSAFVFGGGVWRNAWTFHRILFHWSLGSTRLGWDGFGEKDWQESKVLSQNSSLELNKHRQMIDNPYIDVHQDTRYA